MIEQETSKTTVLFVIPSLSRAGAESQLIDLINGFNSKVFRKLLIVFGDNLDQLDKVNTNSIEFFYFPRNNKWDFSIAAKIARVVDVEKVQVIYSTLHISALFSWMSRFITKRKPILMAAVHTTVNRGAKEEFWEKLIYRKILARHNKVVFVCNKQYEYWIDKYPELKSIGVVVYNGVDTTYFSNGRHEIEAAAMQKKYSIPPQVQILCCIAAFRPEKGHLDLLAVFEKLDGSPHLLLAGEGPMKEAIQAEIDRLELNDRVHLLGVLSDVRPVLELADLSVLASTAVETFSIAMLESMAMGVPVVCPNIGGLSEAVIAGASGELYEVGNREEFLMKLQKVLKDKYLHQKLCKNSKKLVQENFSTKKMIDDVEQIVLECSKGHVATIA